MFQGSLIFSNHNAASSEKYGNTTLNIGLISGGVAANVIAEEAQAMVGVRIAAGGPEAVKRLLSDTVKAVDENLELSFIDGSYGVHSLFRGSVYPLKAITLTLNLPSRASVH